MDCSFYILFFFFEVSSQCSLLPPASLGVTGVHHHAPLLLSAFLLKDSKSAIFLREWNGKNHALTEPQLTHFPRHLAVLFAAAR